MNACPMLPDVYICKPPGLQLNAEQSGTRNAPNSTQLWSGRQTKAPQLESIRVDFPIAVRRKSLMPLGFAFRRHERQRARWHHSIPSQGYPKFFTICADGSYSLVDRPASNRSE